MKEELDTIRKFLEAALRGEEVAEKELGPNPPSGSLNHFAFGYSTAYVRMALDCIERLESNESEKRKGDLVGKIMS